MQLISKEWWIRQAITRAIADQGRTIRIPVHMIETINRMSKEHRKLLQEKSGEPLIKELASKMDVSEEKIRLSNHLDYFTETMHLPFSGKKLGFIAQEIGREINTLGSKSNHTEMQKLVVEMKDNLEKIKEQVLNTL